MTYPILMRLPHSEVIEARRELQYAQFDFHAARVNLIRSREGGSGVDIMVAADDLEIARRKLYAALSWLWDAQERSRQCDPTYRMIFAMLDRLLPRLATPAEIEAFIGKGA